MRGCADDEEEREDDGEDMEEDGEEVQAKKGKGRGKGKYSEEFKDKVVKLLEGMGFLDRRAAKMTQDDFLALLAAFNQAGIHFA